MKKIIAVVFLLMSSAFAQTNGTLSCAGGPLRTTETYSPFENTDNGAGRLQLTINCTVNPNVGATGYLNGAYESGFVTITHAVNVTFTSAILVVSNGAKAGWSFDLEAILPSGIEKHYKMSVMSGIAPPNNQHDQSWPIVISLPAGTTFKVYTYAFADDVSWCAATCYASAQWNLQ